MVNRRGCGYHSVVDPHECLAEHLNRLSPLPDELRSQIAERFVVETFDRGAVFLRAGTPERRMGFVVSGLFRFYYLDSDAKERIKSFAREGEFVVSYASLLTGQPSAYSIEALERSVVASIDRHSYFEGIEREPYWAAIARTYVERLFVEKVRREASFLMEDAATRYERFVAEEPELSARLRLKDVASYLGMSDVTLSRFRSERT